MTDVAHSVEPRSQVAPVSANGSHTPIVMT